MKTATWYPTSAVVAIDDNNATRNTRKVHRALTWGKAVAIAKTHEVSTIFNVELWYARKIG